MSIGMEDGAAEQKCAPTSQRKGGKMMTVRTWRMGNPMAMEMQQMGDSLMAVGVRRSGINLRDRTAHPYQLNSTKTQWMVNPLPVGTQQTDVSLRVKTKCSYPHDLKGT